MRFCLGIFLICAGVIGFGSTVGCEDCTLIGCSNQATITFEEPPEVPYTGTARLDGESIEIRCEDPDECGDALELDDRGDPAEIAIVTIVDAVSGETLYDQREVVLTRVDEWYPNGPECDDQPCVRSVGTLTAGAR